MRLPALHTSARIKEMPARTVLIIEDDAAIRRGIADALTYAGYRPVEAADARRGMDLGVTLDCALVLLDLVLPGGDGLEILQRIRATRPTLPVIVLTARGEERDRVRGLQLGADDYVVKPFGVSELLARIEAVLRRSPERPIDVREIAFAGGVADLSLSEVRFHDGQRVELSPREVELLRYLAAHSTRIISREEILARVWRLDPKGVTTRTIDMHIARLREKLRDDAAQPRILLTLRGRGYRFAGNGAAV
jgi:DNA-binding response OmpR family regulator